MHISVIVIKRVDRPARLLTHVLIACRLISRGLSTDLALLPAILLRV